MLADVICDVIHGVRHCYVIFTLERRCKYIYTYASSLTIGGIFSTMAESWKKLKTSNVFSSFIVC